MLDALGKSIKPVPMRLAVALLSVAPDANAEVLRLAREEEIAELYPDYEVGAMPPFGSVHGHRVFIDRCLVGEPELVFNAGTHTEALCMHYGDIAELAKPVVGVFTRAPGRRAADKAKRIRSES